MAATHRQQCLYGSFGAQVGGYETPMEPKTKEGCFEDLLGKLTNCDFSYRTGCCSVNLATAPFDICLTTSTIHQGTWEATSPFVPEVTCLVTLVSAVDPEATCDSVWKSRIFILFFEPFLYISRDLLGTILTDSNIFSFNLMDLSFKHLSFVCYWMERRISSIL